MWGDEGERAGRGKDVGGDDGVTDERVWEMSEKGGRVREREE